MKQCCSVLVLLLIGLLVGCGGSTSETPAPPSNLQVTLTTVASGFSAPLGLQVPNDNSGRLFVVEQAGAIRIIQNNATAATPFLDIRSRVTSGGELGLLGLAFHPSYAQNGRFFVHYNRTVAGQIQSVIAEYARSATNANAADAASERVLLTLDQPFANHNGGQIAFGPDGFLYIGLGDGGNENDPLGTGQNTGTLLGKILRIDVNTTTATAQYGIPADNPFAAGGGRPEIYAFGFRNPWRFSFDTATGRLFVGDVGQDRFEEVAIVSRGDNAGWSVMEGAHCFRPASGCNQNGLLLPIAEYDHGEGNAVMGGFVYHGTAITGLQDAYVFGDFGSGRIWMLQEMSAGQWTRTQLLMTNRNISSFGQDTAGEIYVVDFSGVVLKLAAQ